ncbi:Low temperature requirement protein LtrA [Micromonospora sediminicola]|uniref:Low temperature requirement protein LtrA n=2 Tax=Micromonospora sediminicola TaxID=946078 RepID=A0A1A9B8G9_9ACTN|nr:Low temperature requirement protein LtrA [Micromonospora sediminicola]
MTPRRRDEPHRSATPLELLFDLVFVVAVAQAGERLAHAVTTGHSLDGVVAYATVFFAIWWAWMNFSWFASAYDTDDIGYRLLTFTQMAGVLVLAAGVPRAFDDQNWTLIFVGYVIMRAALSVQWMRAARNETDRARRTARRYAVGIIACQFGWLLLLAVPAPTKLWLFIAMAAAELSVPAAAERGRPTPWNPRHIAERYGLFTIIVLGETIAAASVALQSAVDGADQLDQLLPIAAGGLLIVFSFWSIYFAVPGRDRLLDRRSGFNWGYGHYVIFASAAAVGAGLEAAFEHAVGHGTADATTVALAVTAPTALFLLAVWLLQTRHYKQGTTEQLIAPTAAALTLAASFTGRLAVPLAGLVTAAAVVASVGVVSHREHRRRHRR